MASVEVSTKYGGT